MELDAEVISKIFSVSSTKT